MSEQSETIGKLAEALAKAQSRMGNALKDAKNPHFQSRFATLASVREACGEHLAAEGISVLQPVVTRAEDGAVGVRTVLAHSSGEWISSTAWCKPERPGPQALGSVISYLRRYSLAAMVGIAQEDDDGNAGERDPKERRELPRAVKPAEGSAGASTSSDRATPPQIKAVNTILTAKGVTAREAKLEELSRFAGRPISSSTDLTAKEAFAYIDENRGAA